MDKKLDAFFNFQFPLDMYKTRTLLLVLLYTYSSSSVHLGSTAVYTRRDTTASTYMYCIIVR